MLFIVFILRVLAHKTTHISLYLCKESAQIKMLKFIIVRAKTRLEMNLRGSEVHSSPPHTHNFLSRLAWAWSSSVGVRSSLLPRSPFLCVGILPTLGSFLTSCWAPPRFAWLRHGREASLPPEVPLICWALATPRVATLPNLIVVTLRVRGASPQP